MSDLPNSTLEPEIQPQATATGWSALRLIGGQEAQIVLTIFSIATAVMAGLALRWQPEFVVVSAAAFGASVWFTRSVARATYATIAALGLLAIAISLVNGVAPQLYASLGLRWSWLGYVLWLLVVSVAYLSGRGRERNGSPVVELVGLAVATAVAAFVLLKIDYAQNLLYLLLHVEDNQAWVAMTTQLNASDQVPGGSHLGPVMLLLIGLLVTYQEPGVALYNSAFSAYALALIALPLIVVGLYRAIPRVDALVAGAFAFLGVALAYSAPLLLFSNYGHLSAIWAYLIGIAALAVFAYEERRITTIALFVGVFGALGAVWFPIAPLALGLLALTAIPYWRRSGWIVRGVLVVLVVGLALVVYRQLTGIGGATAQDGFGRVLDSIRGLYISSGGTAALDNLLLLLIIGALATAGWFHARLDAASKGIWLFLVAAVAYAALVISGAHLLQVPVGYGPTKVAYVLGSVAFVGVVSLVVRAPMPPRALAMAGLGLVMLGLVFGGLGGLLARAWPGAGSQPGWLGAIQAVAAEDSPEERRPVGCFSNDKWTAYMCSRWVAGVTLAGDGQFLSYRLQFVHGENASEAVAAMEADGSLAQSDVIVFDLPDVSRVWAWPLLEEAGRVYDGSGRLMKDEETDNLDSLVQGARWERAADDVVRRVKASRALDDVDEVVCLSPDPTEALWCSIFSTRALGRVERSTVGKAVAADPAFRFDPAKTQIVVFDLDPTSPSTLLERELERKSQAMFALRTNGTVTSESR